MTEEKKDSENVGARNDTNKQLHKAIAIAQSIKSKVVSCAKTTKDSISSDFSNGGWKALIKNKNFIILAGAVFCLLMLFNSCGSDPVSMVKNGTLNFDESITIGRALDNYAYFKNTKWSSFETEQGRKVVQFVGVMDINAYKDNVFLGIELTKGKIKEINKAISGLEISYVCQIQLSRDGESIEVAYSAMRFRGKVNRTGELLDDESTEDLGTLSYIYKNQLDMVTWAALGTLHFEYAQ